MAVYANRTYFFTPSYGLNPFIPLIPNDAQEELILGGGQYNDSMDDLCKDREYAYLCEGNLGIPRHLMPQLPTSSTTRRDFLNEQENQGITVQKGFISADELTPSQSELSRAKVENLRKGSYDPCGGEIIVATGNANGKKYVVDGHHRYAACRLNKGMQKILAIEESIQTVLSKLFTFSGVARRDINNRKM